VGIPPAPLILVLDGLQLVPVEQIVEAVRAVPGFMLLPRSCRHGRENEVIYVRAPDGRESEVYRLDSPDSLSSKKGSCTEKVKAVIVRAMTVFMS
jgi:hypothetical protein